MPVISEFASRGQRARLLHCNYEELDGKWLASSTGMTLDDEVDATGNVSEAARCAHSLENELAAIRIRIDLVLTLMNSVGEIDEELVRSDLEQVRTAAEGAIREARCIARWIRDVANGSADPAAT